MCYITLGCKGYDGWRRPRSHNKAAKAAEAEVPAAAAAAKAAEIAPTAVTAYLATVVSYECTIDEPNSWINGDVSAK
jgi:hypothetical protein